MAFLGSLLADSFVTIAFLLAIVYIYFTSTYNHWKKLNVPYVNPSFPFGNFGRSFTGKASFVQVLQDIYPVIKKRGYGGIFNLRQPVLLICDPELVKQFLTKDFGSFHDRGVNHDEDNDLFANLFAMSGKRWKILRTQLSPAFTSGKIKYMFPLIQECSQELQECIQREKKAGGSVEIGGLLNRFTSDVIATCAFGINSNSLRDPRSEFYQMGRKINKFSFAVLVRMVVLILSPKMAKYWQKFKFFSDTTIFFRAVIDQTVRYRREHNVERNDFVQLMMKIMDKEIKGMSFNQKTMTAQALAFIVAGLDNVANNIGFCLHAMALDEDLQKKAYQEIKTVMEEFEGNMCYEALAKMDLVSRIIDEGLRMYTSNGVLVRSQTEDKYLIPGTDIEIKKGTAVMIPIQSIHLDEEYFPNPDEFDPDRFNDEKVQRHPYTYLPFGNGPRSCIAARFALLEMKLCFAELVRNFKFTVAPETDVSMTLNVRSFTPSPQNGFWLKVTERVLH